MSFSLRSSCAAEPIPTKLVRVGEKWELQRAGKPFFIKGAGGGGSKPILGECGGNSFRTWGVGTETQRELDEAHKLGLAVTVGIWLGHKEHGFRYDDAASVKKQFEAAQQAVEKYKNHPAVLLWAVGNEMEVGNDDPAMWNAVQEIAKMIHAIDPSHPTMTVVAELGKANSQNIHKLCPDIDIVGINSYGGGVSLAERYRKTGATKPYVITEFGPPGTWEIKMNAFGDCAEATSTRKAEFYRDVYKASVLGAARSLFGVVRVHMGSQDRSDRHVVRDVFTGRASISRRRYDARTVVG
ncbi:MAG: glycoside hydrolase family 2 TIM barrel-domain containing protein [Pirellulales bacterium]